MAHTSTPPDRRDWLYPSEVALQLGVSVKTINRWVRDGILPARRTLGGTIGNGHARILKTDVERVLADGATSCASCAEKDILVADLRALVADLQREVAS